jgi:hypothetical protein
MARTRRPSGRDSTRPKDLVDILLIASSERLDAGALRNALESTFGPRGLQPLPASLPPPPPPSWEELYRRLAVEVGIESELDKAFAAAARFFDPILAGRAEGEWDPDQWSWA